MISTGLREDSPIKNQPGMRSFSNNQVVACIPYHNCQRYVRRAVESLLAQTHREIRAIVINDGDTRTPPWPVLADIDDPRLVRIDMRRNSGPFFITQMILLATTAPYFLIQDADDWSHPQRIALLLDAMRRDRSAYAVSAQPQFRERDDGGMDMLELRWMYKVGDRVPPASALPVARYRLNMGLTRELTYRVPHHGLFATQALRAIGGYHPGYRINYDSLVPNLMLMTQKISHVPLPLYYRRIRVGSITHATATGVGSPAAKKEKERSERIYAACHDSYMRYRRGCLSRGELLESIRTNCRRNLDPRIENELWQETARIRAHYRL